MAGRIGFSKNESIQKRSHIFSFCHPLIHPLDLFLNRYIVEHVVQYSSIHDDKKIRLGLSQKLTKCYFNWNIIFKRGMYHFLLKEYFGNEAKAFIIILVPFESTFSHHHSDANNKCRNVGISYRRELSAKFESDIFIQ